MKDSVANEEKGFSKILLAIDGSKPSMGAAEDAIEIAKNNKSQLIVIHVIDFYKYPYLLSSTVLAPTFGTNRFDEDKKKAEEWMKTVRERYAQNDDIDNSNVSMKNIETEIIEGKTSVAATIVDYAESRNVDLIVIGSKGVTGFKKMLVGSVTSDVVKYAHCSVLVIR